MVVYVVVFVDGGVGYGKVLDAPKVQYSSEITYLILSELMYICLPRLTYGPSINWGTDPQASDPGTAQSPKSD